jgi:hypothetical protein
MKAQNLSEQNEMTPLLLAIIMLNITYCFILLPFLDVGSLRLIFSLFLRVFSMFPTARRRWRPSFLL